MTSRSPKEPPPRSIEHFCYNLVTACPTICDNEARVIHVVIGDTKRRRRNCSHLAKDEAHKIIGGEMNAHKIIGATANKAIGMDMVVATVSAPRVSNNLPIFV